MIIPDVVNTRAEAFRKEVTMKLNCVWEVLPVSVLSYCLLLKKLVQNMSGLVGTISVLITHLSVVALTAAGFDAL